ncbi:MAG TPA: glutamine--tRNA ligase, partial [Planctomycetota bacterium]
FPNGARVLRARIDMASGNINLRDPVLYRIRRAHHHRTGDAWCIYPSYDYAHPLSDAIEAITYSLCTLEFEDHRPLYDWVIEAVGHENRPRQIEFARLNLTYVVLSKRRLIELVENRHVDGWDDPRMPTLAGLRRRGVTPEAIRAFCDTIGVSKTDSTVDLTLFENHVRQDLEARCPRHFAVLDPLKLVITNWPEDQVDALEVPNHPSDESFGTRKLPFGREIWVERDDFREEAPRKWHRLAPGKEVRLRYAYYVTCQEVIKDDTGKVAELRCTFDPESRGGGTADERKVRGTLHWVAVHSAIDAEVRLYEPLFAMEDPEEVPEGGSFLDNLNPQSREIRTGAKLEFSLADFSPDDRVQFERLGYFKRDAALSAPEAPVWHRTITLRDSWAKIEQKQKAGA